MCASGEERIPSQVQPLAVDLARGGTTCCPFRQGGFVTVSCPLHCADTFAPNQPIGVPRLLATELRPTVGPNAWWTSATGMKLSRNLSVLLLNLFRHSNGSLVVRKYPALSSDCFGKRCSWFLLHIALGVGRMPIPLCGLCWQCYGVRGANCWGHGSRRPLASPSATTINPVGPSSARRHPRRQYGPN